MGHDPSQTPRSGKTTVIASDFLFHLIRISRVIKHTHLTTKHSKLPMEGIHLRCNKNTDLVPGICFWQS